MRKSKNVKAGTHAGDPGEVERLERHLGTGLSDALRGHGPDRSARLDQSSQVPLRTDLEEGAHLLRGHRVCSIVSL